MYNPGVGSVVQVCVVGVGALRLGGSLQGGVGAVVQCF